MNPEVEARLASIEQKVDAVLASAEKTRRMVFWRGVITVALFVLPLVGLLIALPSFLNLYTNTYPSLINGDTSSAQPDNQASQTMQLMKSLGY